MLGQEPQEIENSKLPGISYFIINLIPWIWVKVRQSVAWIWVTVFQASNLATHVCQKDKVSIEKYQNNWHCVLRRGGFIVRERLPYHVLRMSEPKAKFYFDQTSERLCKKMDRLFPRKFQ